VDALRQSLLAVQVVLDVQVVLAVQVLLAAREILAATAAHLVLGRCCGGQAALCPVYSA
jgi:hypothetical protein